VTSVRVRLTFPETLIREPIVGRVVRDFDVMVNIRRADVAEDFGWIVCELDGQEPAVRAALDWLGGIGVRIDPVDGSLES
jgi:hypothetical protein